MNGVPSALQFVAGESLAPGDYTLRLAASDGERTGSVEHRFRARLSENGAVKLSELMAGGPTAVREFLSPTVGYTVTFGSVHGYLEAYGDQAEAVTVRYEIAASASSPTLIAADVPGRLFGDDRMIYSLVMPVQQLPPGRYVLRALVSLVARPLKTLTRPFEIAASVPIAAPAGGVSPAPGADAADADVFLPVDEQAFVRPFQRDEALKPDVVNLFRERLAPAAQAAFDAGVASLTAGDYRKAEASIKSGIGPDIDSTTLLVYLGVIYAANDDDMQAVGAWQTALFGGGDIPQLYAWLSQGQLRRHSLPEAKEILEEAHEKWPSDARFTGSLAAVYATFGKGKEAILLLEQYLDKSPDDVEAARVGVEWLYQIHAAGRSCTTAPKTSPSRARGPRVTGTARGRRSSSSGSTCSNARRARRASALIVVTKPKSGYRLLSPAKPTLRTNKTQRDDVVSQLGAERLHRAVVSRRDVGKGTRAADVEVQRARTRQQRALRKRLVRPGQMTGNDGRAGTGDQPPDAGAEPSNRPHGASRALREEDENVAARAREQLTADLEALGAPALAIEGQSVDENNGDERARKTREKIVGRGHGKCAMHAPQGKAREQTEGVQVARMITDHHE